MDAPPEVVYGRGVEVSAEALSQLRNSEEDVQVICKGMDDIHAHVRRSGISLENVPGRNQLLAEVQKKWPDISKAFPIAVRMLVQLGDYDPPTFRLYVVNHTRPTYKDRKAYLEAQGAYPLMMFKKRTPRATVRMIAAARERITGQLQEEDKNFMDARDEADRVAEEMRAAAAAERRRRLASFRPPPRS
jgi:hypothetical protein